MRKLKLESVTVESFETTSAIANERGTVNAHGKPGPIETYNVDRCGDTRYFDCTFGCTVETNCYCLATDVNCV